MKSAPGAIVFTVDSTVAVRDILDSGCFEPRFSCNPTKRNPNPHWKTESYAAFADLATLAPGDLVFFIGGSERGRHLKGVGRIGKAGNKASVFWNDKRSPDPSYCSTHNSNPLRVEFEPILDGITSGPDLDRILGGIEARRNWAMPSFAGVNMLALEPDEAGAFLSYFIQEGCTTMKQPKVWAPKDVFSPLNLLQKDPGAMHPTKKKQVRNESILHALLAEHVLTNGPIGSPHGGPRESTYALLHEASASPTKPRIYARKIDLKQVASQKVGHIECPKQWHLFECKKEGSTKASAISFSHQLMKYVDFAAHNWCAGNYVPIIGHLVTAGYSRKVIDEIRQHGKREFVLNPEAGLIGSWSSLNLWEYTADSSGSFTLQRIP